ncbi:SWIM zinc finger family protein [Halorientalis sp.]|uniref:SWIM zinc finger family protein n=1 Tax=Halorientalis sp. TaxID=1931229 RepID=UPI002637BC3A|nr:SWIM zinc finger family protein [Halorientalis sp.]
MPDSSHPLSRLEWTPRILKRAQYEALQFSLIEGDIRVRNASHADPAGHEYRVRIEDGQPVACTCPFDGRSSQACKHRVAVAIRPAIIEAATTMQTLAEARSAQ